MQLLATNITSPLGMTTEETYNAVRRGETGLRFCPAATMKGLPFDSEVALFTDEQWRTILLPGHTHFYSLALASIKEALSHTDIPVGSSRTILILSTTKAEVELLDEGNETMPTPGDTARDIAHELGFSTDPVVVCNACISGVAAQVLAMRLIDGGMYDNAVVCGCDVLSRFIISGFQSLKALSPEPCRPFDIERLGLNLGEAAATMVFGKNQYLADNHNITDGCQFPPAAAWHVAGGAIRNDAYHISGPHPKGLGAQMALEAAIGDVDREEIAVIGVHGTATMYNDQMESKAIDQAGLSDVPISALKGYFGHTMGAAGVIETIITARALDDGIILPCKGYQERGVSGKVTLYAEEHHTDKRCFVKMLSGFGGCNGAVMLTKTAASGIMKPCGCRRTESATVTITAAGADINGEKIKTDLKGGDLLTYIYKERVGGYPKFYKMDILSKLAFLAVELIKQLIPIADDAAVILFNNSSSIVADRLYETSIGGDEGEFFPSPAAFVYTLPNITTGEIAIRHAIHGETSFYILPERNELLMRQIVEATMLGDQNSGQIITGWINATEDDFSCVLKCCLPEE